MTKQKGVLVPLELAQATVNYLGTQPHNQVNGLLVGISQCQQMEVNVPEQEETKVDDKKGAEKP